MTTIIDELVVTLGLDPKGFNQERKSAAADLLKFKDEASKASKEITKRAGEMDDAFAIVSKRVIGLSALFLGGMGIKEFAQHTVNAEADVSRLSASIGQGSREMYMWGQAGAAVNATSEEMIDNFKRLSLVRANAMIGGNPEQLAVMQRLGVDTTSLMGGKLSTTDMLRQLATFAEKNPQKDVTHELLAQVGLTEKMIQLIMGGTKNLEAILREANKNTPSAEAIEAARKAQEAWNKEIQETQKMGTDLVNNFLPGVQMILQVLNGIVAAFKAMYTWEQSMANSPFMKWLNNIGAAPTTGMSSNAWNEALKQRGITIKPKGEAGDGTGVGGGYGDSGGPAPGAGIADRGGGGRGGWWSQDRKQYAVDYLVGGGMNELGARALVARWAAVESTKGGPFDVNGIGASGIAQWLPNRQNGKFRAGDFKSQLDHALEELKGPEARAFRTLQAATTPEQASIGASQFERAEMWNGTYDGYVGKTLNGMNSVPGKSGTGAAGATANALRKLDSFTPNVPSSGVLSGGAGPTSSNSTATNTTHIAEINVHTKATDGPGVARDLGSAIQRNGLMAESNYGMN